MAQDDQPKTRKSKGGRPKGEDSSILAKKRRQYSYSIMERIQERVDPDVLIDFHLAILQNQNPLLERYGDSWRVVPDPSPLATSPTLEQKLNSVKWLTDRGHGLPVQSTQVDIDIRARLDQMGSGASNREIEAAYNPQALKLFSEALKAVGRLPPPKDEVIDAEWTESNENSSNNESLSENNDTLNANNPLPGNDSGESSTQ